MYHTTEQLLEHIDKKLAGTGLKAVETFGIIRLISLEGKRSANTLHGLYDASIIMEMNRAQLLAAFDMKETT